MRKLYAFQTRIGPFYIAEHRGRYHPMFDNESLGSYGSARQAADDLAGGHTPNVYDPSSKAYIDTADLGIPVDLSEWTMY
jgi:hypothetical protein